jgi:hypothetical protein
MKTNILTLVMVALTIFGFQSSISAQSVGIRAGINFQNINGKDIFDNKLNNSMQTGFHVGLNVEIPVAPDFYVRPGLLYSTKGARQEVEIEGDKVKTQLGYLELPVNFLYKPALGSGKLLLGFGPYEFSSRLSVQMNAQWGLTNNNPYQNNAVYKNTGFGFSAGYRFGE